MSLVTTSMSAYSGIIVNPIAVKNRCRKAPPKKKTHSIYMVTRSAAPPLAPPPWSMVQDAPSCGDGVWVPSSACGVVVGVLGFWV